MALVWKDEINSIITIKGNNFLKSIGKHDFLIAFISHITNANLEVYLT